MDGRILIWNRHNGGMFEVPLWRDSAGGLYIPRKDETIVINGIAYTVDDVVWDYEEGTLKSIVVKAV